MITAGINFNFPKLIIALFGILRLVECEENDKKAEVGPLVGLMVQPSKDFLYKNEDNVLVCEFQNSELSRDLILSDVKWLRDGKAVGELSQNLDYINANGPVLQLFGRSKSSDLEGDYQCQAILKSPDGPIGPVLSSAFRLMQVSIDKFPRRTQLDRSSENFGTVEAIQGEIAFLPCVGGPASVPGPPLIYFERKFPSKMSRAGTKDKDLQELRPEIQSEVFQDRYLITNEGLQIAVVQPSDSGRYRCLAQNSVSGQTRRSKIWIHLKVTKSKSKDLKTEGDGLKMVFPTIKETRKTVQVGETLTLDCVGMGGQVQWEKVNDSNWRANLDGPEAGSRFVKIWGNLKLVYAKPEDAGTYACSLMPPVKDEGTAENNDEPKGWKPPTALYHVKVSQEPRSELKVEKMETGNWKVNCRFDEENKRPELVLNSRSLLTTGSLNVLDYKYSSKLGESFLLGDPLPSGALQCLAPPGDGRFRRGHSSNLHLTPRAATSTPDDLIEIEEGPDDSTRMIGDWVTLICKVKGTRRVLWLKDGEKLYIRGNQRYNLLGSGSLDIKGVKETDSGLYTCVAVGATKNVTAAASLRVESTGLFGLSREELPSIEYDDDSKDDYIYEDSETTSSPDTTQWKTTEKPSSWEISGSGQTPGIDEYWGTTRSSSTVIVVTTRKPPGELRIEAPEVFQHGSNSSMMVQWAIPPAEELPSRLVHFKVQVKEAGTDLWKTLDQNLPPNVRQHTVHDLEVGKSYKFRIGLAFADGIAISSRTTKYHRLAPISPMIKKPTEEPRIVALNSLSSTAIEVRWTYPVDREPAHLDGFTIRYRVRYSGFGRNHGETKLDNITVPGGHTREHVLEGLVPAAPYEIYMVAFNSAGHSKDSKIVIGHTLKMDGSPALGSFLTTESPKMSTTLKNFFNNVTLMNNREGDLLVSIDSKTLLIFLATVLGLLILTLAFCMIYCSLRQRKQTKINEAARGKFLDTSKRIYKEQRLKEGNLSLYYDAMTVSIAKEPNSPEHGGTTEALTTSTLLIRPDSSRYTPEDRAPTPIVATVKPMRNGSYRNRHRDSSPPAPPSQVSRMGTIYTNPGAVPLSNWRGDSSDMEEDNLMLLVAGGAPLPKRKYQDKDRRFFETEGIGLIDTDDELSAPEKQGSTPECDMRDGPSPYSSAYPPPPPDLSNKHHLAYNAGPTYQNYSPQLQHQISGSSNNPNSLVNRSYLLPYHDALAATEPGLLGSGGTMAPGGSDGTGSPYGYPVQLSLNTSGTTASAGSERSSGSPRSGSRSRTPQILTPAPHTTPLTASTPTGVGGSNSQDRRPVSAQPLAANQRGSRPTSQDEARNNLTNQNAAHFPPPPGFTSANGSTSPLIPKKDWDIMWTRGGSNSATNLGRTPSDRSDTKPQFYTFRPPGQSQGPPGPRQTTLGVPAFRPAPAGSNYGTYDSSLKRQEELAAGQGNRLTGYLSDN